MFIEVFRSFRSTRPCKALLLSATAGLLSLSLTTLAPAVGEPTWDVIKPSNTGIPGEAVRFGKFDPQGKLWVSARWPFWGEGGVGIYNFDTQLWTTHSNLPRLCQVSTYLILNSQQTMLYGLRQTKGL